MDLSPVAMVTWIPIMTVNSISSTALPDVRRPIFSVYCPILGA